MNSNFVLGCFLLASATTLSAVETSQPSDSLKMNLQEIVVTKSLRDNAFLTELPVSSTVLSGTRLADQNRFDLKSASAQVPNLFIPDYGSKLTSAIYIRGIGTRMNASVAGFYVDDVPYLDKSAFDFDWQDIQRMDVLRGPQGTLYGRNAMGGVIHLHTLSPFENTGTTLRLSYGSYNDWMVQASHAQKINEQLAYSIAGNYQENAGFFTNQGTGDQVGATQTAGVRGKFAGRYANGWRFDWSSAFEYTKQDGYAYSPVSSDTISYNDACSYQRNLFTVGLNVARVTDKTEFHSVTGYQQFSDKLALDQDFSTASLFTLHQNQDFNALTQEFVYKSTDNRPLQWVFGAFGSASSTETYAPVQFKQDGVANLMEANINRGIPASLAMTVDITDNVLDIPSRFNEKRQNAALYHQFTWKLPYVKGLSLTGGLRLEYERIQLNWNSSADMNYLYTMVNHGITLGESLTANALLKGDAAKSYIEVTPKIALEYAFNPKNKVYASLTRGHQSGGYNVQLFSDLIQTELQAVMSQQMKTSMASQLQALVALSTHHRFSRLFRINLT
jgi:outer membrane receptor protein involved in Fe transport